MSIVSKPGFSSQCQAVFQATQTLWHESNVEFHAEGAPGLAGPASRGKPVDPDVNFIESAIHTLTVIRDRLTTNDDLSDREWKTLKELDLHFEKGTAYPFNPKTCEILCNKGLAVVVNWAYVKRTYQITKAGRERIRRK